MFVVFLNVDDLHLLGKLVFGCVVRFLTRFNNISTQGAPQMAVDKEAIESLLLLF